MKVAVVKLEEDVMEIPSVIEELKVSLEKILEEECSAVEAGLIFDVMELLELPSADVVVAFVGCRDVLVDDLCDEVFIGPVVVAFVDAFEVVFEEAFVIAVVFVVVAFVLLGFLVDVCFLVVLVLVFFFVLVFVFVAGFGSTASPVCALFDPKARHLENRSHSLFYIMSALSHRE